MNIPDRRRSKVGSFHDASRAKLGLHKLSRVTFVGKHRFLQGTREAKNLRGDNRCLLRFSVFFN